MTEPCRTECGKQVTYEKITFSDGIFFSIPLLEGGVIHNCENIQNAEYDLEEMDNSMLTEMSECRGALNHEGRKKYRTAIQAIAVDVLWQLEDKLGFKEDREELRGTIGFYLNKIFTAHTYADPKMQVENLPLITRIIGNEFTYLELLGFLYQLDGLYVDAKWCFESMRLFYVNMPEELDEPAPAGAEWGMGNTAKLI